MYLLAMACIRCYNSIVILSLSLKERLITLKKFLTKNWRIFFLMYIFIYLPWFFLIENYITSDLPNLHIMHFFLDDYIPFNEYFIIPYISWFFYIAVACMFIYFKGTDSEYLKLALSLVIGMSLSLTICMIYPSGLNIRPESFPRDNVFTSMVTAIYLSDTPTNVFPSIHVYNSLAIHISLSKMKALENYKWVKICSLVIAVLICLSTVFLKQHSLLDVMGAFSLMIVMYIGIYILDYNKLLSRQKKENEILE